VVEHRLLRAVLRVRLVHMLYSSAFDVRTLHDDPVAEADAARTAFVGEIRSLVYHLDDAPRATSGLRIRGWSMSTGEPQGCPAPCHCDCNARIRCVGTHAHSSIVFRTSAKNLTSKARFPWQCSAGENIENESGSGDQEEVHG
jgi:hypothetical protein